MQELTLGLQIAWLIAFVASIIAAIHGSYPNYSWWSLVYTFFCILGVLVTVASDSIYTYHVSVSCLSGPSKSSTYKYRLLGSWQQGLYSRHHR